VQKTEPCGDVATSSSYGDATACAMLTEGDGTILAMPGNGLRSLHCPVNIGGIPATNVQALRRKGLEARLLMFHAPKLRSDVPDIVLDVPDGLWRRQLVQARAFARLLPETDVFHFYFGHTLIPRRVQFPVLRAARRKSVMHYLGSDIRGKPPAELAWGKRANAEIVGSWDAHRWVPEAHVVPPPIDLTRYHPTPPPENARVRVAHAPSNRAKKGTDAVIAACAELPVDLDLIEGVKHDEARKRYAQADVIVDQLVVGWYGLFAIESMATGRPVVTYLHDDAVAQTETAFGVKVPIVNATKDTLVERLRPLVESAELRRELGERGRAYVERVHDVDHVGGRLVEIYESL
jgi:glycosyltransferase involved in cell wall biosynthesis